MFLLGWGPQKEWLDEVRNKPGMNAGHLNQLPTPPHRYQWYHNLAEQERAFRQVVWNPREEFLHQIYPQ